MAIAWLYRDDYARAGFPMLPVVEPDGRRAGRQAVFYAAALVPVSLVPTFVGMTGAAYFWIALVLGVGLLWMAARFALSRTDPTARAPLLQLDHLSAAHLDGDVVGSSLISFQSYQLSAISCSPQGLTKLSESWELTAASFVIMTVHDLPAVNATLNALSGVLLIVGYAVHPRAAHHSASAVHDRGVRHVVGVPRLLRHLSRAGGIGAVHATGVRPAALLFHSDHARDARRSGAAAGDDHAVARAAGAVSADTARSRAGPFRSGCTCR